MTDFTDLLGQLMPSGISHSGKDRLQHAMGDQGLSGLGGILSDLLGGGQFESSGGSLGVRRPGADSRPDYWRFPIAVISYFYSKEV